MTFWLGFDLERQHKKKKSKLNFFLCINVVCDDLMGQMSWFIINIGRVFLYYLKMTSFFSFFNFKNCLIRGGRREKKIRGLNSLWLTKKFLVQVFDILDLKMHHFVECHQKVRPALDDLELSMEHRGNDRMNSIGSRRGVQIRFFCCCCSTVV